MRQRKPGRKVLREYVRLCKVTISLFAAGSALAGFIVRSPRLNARALLPWGAVFILACGACALNEYQDRRRDAQMERTRHRPLPVAAVGPAGALGLAVALLVTGLALMAFGGKAALLLGVAAVIWYNGLYAYLKRVTAFAAVPGAVTGALPPAIGWVWAGGGLDQAGIWVLALFFFVWQVPHFWLVAMDHGLEYRQAGLPSLGDSLSADQIRRVTSQWVVATAACSLLLSLSGLINAVATRSVLILAAFWLGTRALSFHAGRLRPGAALFREMNFYLLGVSLLLCFDHVATALIP